MGEKGQLEMNVIERGKNEKERYGEVGEVRRDWGGMRERQEKK